MILLNNELVYAYKSEEIVKKKKLIKDTYEAQLAEISLEEATLNDSKKEDIDILSNYSEIDMVYSRNMLVNRNNSINLDI